MHEIPRKRELDRPGVGLESRFVGTLEALRLRPIVTRQAQ
jgi:hypothetical protein